MNNKLLCGKTGSVVLLVMMMVFTAAAVPASPGTEYRFTAEIVPGDHYSHWKWFGIWPVKLTPQIAVWIETADGRFVDTVYSTRSNGENSWRGADERPEALPVYNGRRAGADANSGATPAGKKPITLERPLAAGPGAWVVRAEVNSSFDYNEAYPEQEGDVNGQPSLLYRGEFVIGDAPGQVSVRLLPEETAGLTTALSIVDSINLTVKVQ